MSQFWQGTCKLCKLTWEALTDSALHMPAPLFCKHPFEGRRGELLPPTSVLWRTTAEHDRYNLVCRVAPESLSCWPLTTIRHQCEIPGCLGHALVHLGLCVSHARLVPLPWLRGLFNAVEIPALRFEHRKWDANVYKHAVQAGEIVYGSR